MSCENGCSFNSNEEVVDKVRMKGVENEVMNTPYEINCECGEIFLMTTYVSNCPKCNMTYGVTPCSSDDIKNIVKTKIGY